MTINEDFFASYPYLVILYLHHNKLKILPERMFIALQSIRMMSLHQNMLQKVNLDMLNNATLELQRITLFDNPWKCDCTFGLPFKEWIENNLNKVENKNDIKCDSVQLPTLDNSTLNSTLTENATMEVNNSKSGYSFTLADEQEGPKSIWKVDFAECHERNIPVENPINKDIIVISSVLAGVFLILVAVGILTYYYRELIMVWMYNNSKTNWFWRPKEEVN